MTKILLVGANGQVGQELRHTLTGIGQLVSVGRQDMNLTEVEAIRQVIRREQPDLIVNAAAYTAVDKAESEPELASQINAIAPTVMAEEVQRLGGKLIHISTDYVFNGKKSSPYREDDMPSPLGTYGQSKLLGEDGVRQACDNHIILRTAWVYGTKGKGNFVKTMLRLAAERDELRVVADQIGSPTWSGDIAAAIARLIDREASEQAAELSDATGTYHFTNSGVASWYDFAVAIFEEAKTQGASLKVQRVVPITTADYPTPAQRPAYSVLSGQKISKLIGSPPHWRHSLRQMLVELYTS
ncbi:MAG: dTDP-4-dehydrorhamnose reductase [Cyanobacteria bacterium P01_A01_bin.135]